MASLQNLGHLDLTLADVSISNPLAARAKLMKNTISNLDIFDFTVKWQKLKCRQSSFLSFVILCTYIPNCGQRNMISLTFEFINILYINSEQ